MGEYFSALGAREGMVSEFETSLGLRLDYEACLAYLAVPPLGAILLLILERKSDYVRYVFFAVGDLLVFFWIFWRDRADHGGGVCVQVPCVAVELAVHRAVRAALGVFVVQVSPLGVLPGGPGVDSVAGVEGVSGRRYARPVGSPLALGRSSMQPCSLYSRYEVPIVGRIASRILDDE